MQREKTGAAVAVGGGDRVGRAKGGLIKGSKRVAQEEGKLLVLALCDVPV